MTSVFWEPISPLHHTSMESSQVIFSSRLSGPGFDLGMNPLYHKVRSELKLDFTRTKMNTDAVQAVKDAARRASESLPPALRLRESDPSNMVGFVKQPVLKMLRDSPSKLPGELRRLLNDADRLLQSPRSAALPDFFEGNERGGQVFFTGDHTGIEVMTPRSAKGSTPGLTNLEVLKKTFRGAGTGLATLTGGLTGGAANKLQDTSATANIETGGLANKDTGTAVGVERDKWVKHLRKSHTPQPHTYGARWP